MCVYFCLLCNLSSEEKIKAQEKHGNNPFLPYGSGLLGRNANPEGQGGNCQPYLQSVKKTCAARYLAVGGSLKSPMRECTDCSEEKKGRIEPVLEANGTYF